MVEPGRWTPGPWRVQPHDPDDAPRAPVDVCGSGWVIAADLKSVEDARLIAAAPELYEALANLVPRFHRCMVAHGTDAEFADEAVTKARAALASAHGESQEASRGE